MTAPPDEELFCLWLDKSSLQSLSPEKWLDDAVIDSFSQALAEESVGEVAHFITFWQQCMLSGRSGEMLRKRLQACNVSRAKLWLMPYNRQSCHWALFIVCVPMKAIIHIDSLKLPPSHLDISYIQRMLQAVYPDLEASQGWSSWKLVVPDEIPLQPDDFSCGTRVCFYAEVAATGVVPLNDFDDVVMRQVIRRRIQHPTVSE